MRIYMGPYSSEVSDGEREISIELHDYDVWGMGTDLAMIIHPLLIMLKEKKQGCPFVDDADVPEELQSKLSAHDIWQEDYEKMKAKWEYIIELMIWSMNEIRLEFPGENEFHILDENGEFVGFRQNCLEEYTEKINRGTAMFGKYFLALWD